jgi:hypothetical protein
MQENVHIAIFSFALGGSIGAVLGHVIINLLRFGAG